MTFTFKILAAIIVFLVPALLVAQSARNLHDASNKIEEVTEQHLNVAYKRLIQSINDEGGPNAELSIERLRESQRAWLKYREAQVAFIGTHADLGSSSARAEGMASYSVELTKQRIKDLDEVPNPF